MKYRKFTIFPAILYDNTKFVSAHIAAYNDPIA